MASSDQSGSNSVAQSAHNPTGGMGLHNSENAEMGANAQSNPAAKSITRQKNRIKSAGIDQ